MTGTNRLAPLRLVIAKVDKLERLGFVQYMMSGGKLAVRGRHAPPDEGVVFEGPGEDATDAFVLTLRFFIQDNESSSLSNLQRLFEELPLPEERKEAVRISRKAVNEHLDGPSPIVLDGVALTRRHILNTFIYGDLAHTRDAVKQRDFELWRQRPFLFPMLRMEFAATLSELFAALMWFRDACQVAINELSKAEA